MKTLADGYLVRDDGVIEINPDVVYPKLMAELQLTDRMLDQFWLEVIYQIAKLDAQRLVKTTEHDKRQEGVPLTIHILSGRTKQRWQLKRYPEGRGVYQATKGLDARRHFVKLRGALP